MAVPLRRWALGCLLAQPCFGAALYDAAGQHPATLAADESLAAPRRRFSPTSPDDRQAPLALLGKGTGKGKGTGAPQASPAPEPRPAPAVAPTAGGKRTGKGKGSGGAPTGLRDVALDAAIQGAAAADPLAAESPVRLVVLACKRPTELRALFASLLAVGVAGGFLGHTVALDVSVDLPKDKSVYDEATLAVARSFEWPHGPLTVSLQPRHAGILGQWLSVTPRHSADWFVVLEDDLAVSPCFYRYLLHARQAYGTREDVAGVTLQASPHRPCPVFPLLPEGDANWEGGPCSGRAGTGGQV